MDWSDYLRQQAVIEDCRQSYYDNMVKDITECDNNDYEDEDDYDEENYKNEGDKND